MWYKSSFTIPAVAALCFCSIGGTTPAYADLGDQLAKLLASDGVADDWFGRSVAISGEMAIVGAQFDDDNGTDSGSAYPFDISDPNNPVEIAKVLASDGAADDNFGRSVAISGTTAIVGTFQHDDNGIDSGSAYLFDLCDPKNPVQIAKLLPLDGAAADWFGLSVAISGTTAIVGARRDDDNGPNSGSAYLFDTATGVQIAKLLPLDGAGGDWFGVSVAISKTVAIVGARFDDDNGTNSGSAYLFDTATGLQIAKLLPADGAPSDLFGDSVAMSGNIAIVGAWQDDDNGVDSGSAYPFDICDPKNPVQMAKVLASDGAADDDFGWSVAISGTTAIIGARDDDDNGTDSGSAYLFDLSDPKNPVQIGKLLADDGAADDRFGHAVAISGPPGEEVAIVGARHHDDNGLDSGSAYLFDAAAPGKCPWDLDGSGSVGVSDLLALLASWGPCKGCPADFDGNDDVGVSDLLVLLANWGPCP